VSKKHVKYNESKNTIKQKPRTQLTNQEVEQVIAFLTLLGQIRMRTLKTQEK